MENNNLSIVESLIKTVKDSGKPDEKKLYILINPTNDMKLLKGVQ